MDANASECLAFADASTISDLAVSRLYLTLAHPLGEEAASEYFHTDLPPFLECGDGLFIITVAVRSVYEQRFREAYGRRLEGDEIVVGEILIISGTELSFVLSSELFVPVVTTASTTTTDSTTIGETTTEQRRTTLEGVERLSAAVSVSPSVWVVLSGAALALLQLF